MKKLLIILLIAMLLSLTLVVVSCSNENDTTGTTAQSSTTDKVTTTPFVTSTSAVTTKAEITTTAPVTTTPVPIQDWENISLSSSDIYTGSLILVNSQSPYCYKIASLYTPTELDKLSSTELSELGWSSLYSNKTGNYCLRSRLIFMKNEAFSSFNLMLESFVGKTKNKDVQVRYAYQLVNTAKDSISLSDERVTGLVIEINVLTDEGTFSIDHTSKKESYYDWFADNCHLFGFVMTGESGYFRYVGNPHATYMYRNHLSLEEYLTKLRDYSYESPLSVVDDKGNVWSVYFSPVSFTSISEIKVKKDFAYTVSGNNRDGFIVATRAK